MFLALEITEIVLAIGFFRLAHGDSAYIGSMYGGWCGIVTAAVAWYASVAGSDERHVGTASRARRRPDLGRRCRALRRAAKCR